MVPASLENAESRSSTGSRAIWTFADQGLSSLTNAGLTIIVARTVTESAFGAFALGLLTYSFAVGLGRALNGEPFVVRFSVGKAQERHAAVRRTTGSTVSLGILATLICVVVAVLGDGSLREAFAALAICFPGLCLQDNYRYVFFAYGHPVAAFLNDLLWTVLQFGALGIMIAAGHDSIFLLTLAWGLAANAAAVLGMLQTRTLPKIGATLHWMREVRDLNRALAMGFAINTGAIQIGTYTVGGVVGLIGVSALRGAQTLVGPLNLLFSGFNATMLPILTRRGAAGRALLPVSLLGSGLLTFGAVIWVGALLLLPDRWGEQILGESWHVADQALLPTGLLMVIVAMVLGASNGLIARSRTDLSLRVTAAQATVMLVLGVGGAWVFGFLGAAYGFAIAQAVGLVLCWFFFLQVERDRAAGRHPAKTDHVGPQAAADPSVPDADAAKVRDAGADT